MAGIDQIRTAKLIGKFLREKRQDRGLSLASLAAKLQLSLMAMAAIEDGNLFPFDASIAKFIESAQMYAKELGASIQEVSGFAKYIDLASGETSDEDIPVFLRKKDA